MIIGHDHLGIELKMIRKCGHDLNAIVYELQYSELKKVKTSHGNTEISTARAFPHTVVNNFQF